MFQPISLIWLIRLGKNHRWIKSTQNALSNGEISTVLASIVKTLQINIYKLPPEKIMKMVANNQPMFWSFSNAEPGVQATCDIIHRRAGVIHVIAGMFLLLLGCCCCWWECYIVRLCHWEIVVSVVVIVIFFIVVVLFTVDIVVFAVVTVDTDVVSLGSC